MSRLAELMYWSLVGREGELERVQSLLDDPDVKGALLVGPAGIGKTALSRTISRSVGKPAMEANLVAATASTQTIPFGAMAHLLPADIPDSNDRLEVLRWGQQAIAKLVRRTGGVLVVDDAPLLDSMSAAVLQQLVVEGSVFVVLTLREGQRLPDPVEYLWNGGLLERIQIGPLSQPAVYELVEKALEGPVQGRTLHRLWRLSGGNPFYLRELVLGAHERGYLRRDTGVWGHEGSLAELSRIREVIEARLQRLSSAERAVLEALVLVEPVSWGLLEKVTDPEALESLERRQLIDVGQDGRRVYIRTVHPLYAEAVAATVPKTRARRIRRQLADQLEAHGYRRRGDLLRLATWTIESGRSSDPAVLVRAAKRARVIFDHRLSERLARSASNLGGGFEASLTLAEAIGAQGRIDEAERLLIQLAAEASDDDELTRATLARSDLLVFQRGDPDVLNLLERAARQVADPDCRDELEGMLVFGASYLGELPRAIEGGRVFAVGRDRNPAARVRVLVVHTYARALMADHEDLQAEIDLGLKLAQDHPDAFPIASHLLLVNRAFALRGGGRLLESERMAREQYEGSVAEDVQEVQGLWATQVAHVLDMRGHALDANRYYDEAVALLQHRDPVGMRPFVLGLASYAAGLLGDRDKVGALLSTYGEEIAGRVPAFGTAWEARGRSWLLYTEGNLAQAAKMAKRAGEIALRENLLVFAAQYFHDAVRFGHPELVVDELISLEARTDGDLISLLVTNARALVDGDATELESLATAFEKVGADLYAAEAAAQASFLHAEAGHFSPHRRARTRAARLATPCAGVGTPWLWAQRPFHLTQREFEVAHLAARGFTNREIGTRLYISPRTVGNHLAATYSKTGISGRRQLGEVLEIETG